MIYNKVGKDDYKECNKEAHLQTNKTRKIHKWRWSLTDRILWGSLDSGSGTPYRVRRRRRRQSSRMDKWRVLRCPPVAAAAAAVGRPAGPAGRATRGDTRPRSRTRPRTRAPGTARWCASRWSDTRPSGARTARRTRGRTNTRRSPRPTSRRRSNTHTRVARRTHEPQTGVFAVANCAARDTLEPI